MSQQVVLNAEIRDKSGKGYSRKLRRQGMVPVVLYGQDIESLTLAVNAKDLERIIKHYGRNVLINLKSDNDENTVMLREVQKSIIQDDIIHADFFKISLEELIEVTVPIVLLGDAIGIKDGGILQNQLRELTIKALPTEIPDVIELDITDLEFGETLSVADVEVAPGIEVQNEPEEIIASVVAPMEEEEEEVIDDEDVDVEGEDVEIEDEEEEAEAEEE
ncbi:MAG TPA: 50S ribosomal protein L25/general stress protein Ctc [Thermoanaerobacterales bacterium]|nr:50S ribosomal protein L25/general stress protein Ctc [Thermoanaerobacterales bacterium]